MAVTLNANTSTGFIATSDTSGVLQLQTGGTTAVTISSGQVATFAQAPVLPAASIPQAALAAGVAGNGPAFSAYTSGGQSITNAVSTKITFNTEFFDTNNNFDSSTNYRFTPTVAGYYQVSYVVFLSSAAGIISAVLQKNGVQYLVTQAPLSSTGVGLPLSTLVYLNGTTDYIEAYVYQTSGSTLTTNASRSDLYQFSAAMIRGA
jgi:hypothetical protein